MNQSQDSIYLYSKESREDYLEAFESKKCPHQFKVLSFLDNDQDKNQVTDKESFLSLHLQTCRPCKEQALKVIDYFKGIDKLIPDLPLSAQSKGELERFHTQLIRGSRWDISFEHKMKTFFHKGLIPAARDFGSVLTKPSVLIASFVAVMLVYFALHA